MILIVCFKKKLMFWLKNVAREISSTYFPDVLNKKNVTSSLRFRNKIAASMDQDCKYFLQLLGSPD